MSTLFFIIFHFCRVLSLAILNSKLLSYYLEQKFKNAKKLFPKIPIKNIEKFSIKKLPLTEQQPFIDLVDQILAAKQRTPAADTRAPEADIDRLVYALYGLTEEEIAIVEGR